MAVPARSHRISTTSASSLVPLASSRASRVLPTPGDPITVARRACPVASVSPSNNARSRRSSTSRPMNGVESACAIAPIANPLPSSASTS